MTPTHPDDAGPAADPAADPDHDAAAPADPVGPALPRARAGSSPQHLLTTLLGDYWAQRSEHLPSAALVALLGEFEIAPAAARAALNRLARRGVLVSSRRGRTTSYGLAPGATDLLLAGAHRFVSFGSEPRAWDGRWTLVLLALNERERDQRYVIRSRLRWLGFAPLYDGTWVSPRPVAEQARQELDSLGLQDLTIFTAEAQPGAARPPIAAWHLDDVAATYRLFVSDHDPLRAKIRSGQVSAAEALLARTSIMDRWRAFPGIDPDLPLHELPHHWPRPAAYALFVEVYDALGPLAAIRVRQLVHRHSPELAELITFATTDYLLETGRRALDRRQGSGRRG